MQGMLSYSVVLLNLVSLTSPPAADKAVEDLFAKMRKAYSSVGSAKVEVRLRLNSPSGWQTGIISIDYQRPNLIRYVAQLGDNSVKRWCDGKKVTTRRNMQITTSDKVDVDTMGGQIPGNLEWLCFFDWKRQLSTSPGNNMAQSTFKLIPSEKWNDKTWIVLEETAKPMDTFVRYSIDAKTSFIWRCEVKQISTDRDIMETQVKSLSLGVQHDKSIFTAPPAT